MLQRTILPLALALIVGGILYAWIYSQNRFEIPPPGMYLGAIEGLHAEESTPLLVEVSSDKKGLLIWVARKGFSPVQKPLNDESWIEPITFQSEEGPTEVISQQSGNIISGSIFISSTNARGNFTLTKFPEQTTDSETLSLAKGMLTVRSELESIYSKIKENKERQSAANAEIERLTGFLNDGELLRGSAQKRLSEERQKLSEKRKILNAEQAEVKKLDRQVELAYRVTGMGRLVSLARESLERERRWQESLLRVGTADIPPEVLEQSVKAERILEIKRLIDSENERIYDLLHPEEIAPQAQEDGSSEEQPDD